jgi:hypothetical protein
MRTLEEQLAAERQQREQERAERDAAAAQALADAKAALEHGGVSVPPGAWGH